MHNWLLWRHVSRCDSINCVLYQLGSWSQGALVRERSNSSLIIGKLLPWESGLEGRVCQTSPISTTIFYIACVCKGRVVIISDLLQTSRKLFNSDVTLAMWITDNTMYFQAIHKGIFLCLSFLQNGNGATRWISHQYSFCSGYFHVFVFSEWGEMLVHQEFTRVWTEEICEGWFLKYYKMKHRSPHLE